MDFRASTLALIAGLALLLAHSGLAASDCHDLLRIHDYRSVTRNDLAYDETKIFKDPQDTETISSVGLSAIRPGDRVLELGSGSGIPAKAFLNQGRASQVVGLDISQQSVEHAQNAYGSQNLSFHVADYETMPSAEIVNRFRNGKKPNLIVSNPPYVPSIGHGSGLLGTINGGPTGLRFIHRVIELADTLDARLAFILGSYSSPLEAFRMLEDMNYQITQLTFSVLPFGAFSEANKKQILKLESSGSAFLLRNVFKDRLAYAAIGIVAEKTNTASVRFSQSEAQNLLSRLTSATRPELETLPQNYSIPLRVLVLDGHPAK